MVKTKLIKKEYLFYFVLGVGAGSILFNAEISDALYGVPPTPAVKTIYIFNNGTWPSSNDGVIDANSSSYAFGLGTDGSILINITEITP